MKSGRTFYIQALLVAGILLVLNLFAGQMVVRYDLTEDGRYTLNPVSIGTMDSLKRQMTVKVYLEGDNLPARVKRFRDAIRTTLTELKVHAGDKLVFEFIDPSSNNALMQKLVDMGVPAIPIVEKKNENEVRQQYIFPGAVINYAGNEEVVNLLFSDCVQAEGGMYNCNYTKAESELEYKLVSHMQRVMPGQKRIVGVVQSNGAMPLEGMKEWASELMKFYDVVKINLADRKLLPVGPALLPDSVRTRLPKDALGYDVLIVPKPTKPFSERDKYILDQYVMMGGRILWLVDQEEVDELDLTNGKVHATLSILRQLNLDDQFFRYGFRIATNLIEAAPSPSHSGPIEVLMDAPGASGERGMRPVPAPYPFYPIVIKAWMADHAITRGLETVVLRYASSIDTLEVPDMKYYPLLRTSPFSRPRNGSIMIDLQKAIMDRPPRDLFRKKGGMMTGLALEGKFNSVFKSRKRPDSLETKAPTIYNNVDTNRMVVFSDGDLAGPGRLRNVGAGAIMPAHNKLLLMNAVEWLLGDRSYNQIRNRNVMIARLDAEKVVGMEWLIRSLNIALPIVLVIAFGMLRFYLRRRRNEALKLQA